MAPKVINTYLFLESFKFSRMESQRLASRDSDSQEILSKMFQRGWMPMVGNLSTRRFWQFFTGFNKMSRSIIRYTLDFINYFMSYVFFYCFITVFHLVSMRLSRDRRLDKIAVTFVTSGLCL